VGQEISVSVIAWLQQLSVNRSDEEGDSQLLQLRVLRLGFLKDGDFGVGVFPEDVLERVPSYFESRADAVGATAPIFSATTLAAP
jgi:hypothetical protein